MRGLVAAVLAIGLVGMCAGPAVAQSPSASTDRAGQQIELPQVGIAITFPEDWDVRTTQEDPKLGFIVVASPERFGPDVGIKPVLAAQPKGQVPDTFPDACTLTLYRPIALNAQKFLDELYGRADGITIESLDETLSRVLHTPWSQDHRQHGFYAIGGESVVALLWCWAVEPPEDDWLSIAESIEFLPFE